MSARWGFTKYFKHDYVSYREEVSIRTYIFKDKLEFEGTHANKVREHGPLSRLKIF